MEALKKLGLTKYERAVYNSLLEKGRSNAIELSDHSRVPITAVYPNLKSLINKQLVHQLKGDPSIFEAVDPRISINSLIKLKEKEFSDLKEEIINYADSLKNNKRNIANKQILSITHGKEISKEVYLESFPKAKKSFYILGWRIEKIGDKYDLLKKFRKLIQKKIDVRIILIGSTTKKWEVIRDYIDEGIKIKYLPLDNFSIFILDSKECKITLKDKTLMDKFNIQILDESFAKSMNGYFLDCWEKAEEINKFL